MSLSKSIDALKAAFDAVADELQNDYPALWAAAAKNFVTDDAVLDTDAVVNFLVLKQPVGFNGKTLIDVADAYGEDKALNYIQSIECGGYA